MLDKCPGYTCILTFRCKEKAHYSTSKDCTLHPSKKQEGLGFTNSTWQEYEASINATVRFEEDELQEYAVNNTVHIMQGLLPTRVLLDNQANISILHAMLLSNARKAKQKKSQRGRRHPADC
jgi:hypothetical protein